MKKIIILTLFITLVLQTIVAAPLEENEFYLKSVELQALSNEAFENGDYDAASDYAAQAQENLQKSDEYIAQVLAKDEALNSIEVAQTRIDEVSAFRPEARFPVEYENASSSFESANNYFNEENYIDAKAKAEEVITILANIRAEDPLPAYYIVEKKTSMKDCFWLISKKPYIYNSYSQWKAIYNANKDILQDPENPDLLQPGTKLVIPSIAGETRSGTYDPENTYPVFTK